MIDYSVLRENDIRGIYRKNITEELAYKVGCAFGTYLTDNNKTECVVGYDNRISGESLVREVIKGLINTGINVKFIGMSTTPFLNYATILFNIEAGIMVTASHNPANENGFKIFGDRFLHLKREELLKFYELIKNEKYIKGNGSVELIDIKSKYVTMLKNYIKTSNKKLKVAIDPGNGTTCIFIKDIINNLNIEPIYINDISDGTFPVHNPDPNNDNNLIEIKKIVVENNCDLGMAFDGDGDRVGIVDELGNTIESDKLIAIYANYMQHNKNNKVILDVKCSKALEEYLTKINIEPLMLKNGSAYLETQMLERDILLGGEYSGHIFFRDRYYGFDDGIYAALRMYEILTQTDKKCSELIEGYTKYYNTPEIKVKTTDEKKWQIVEKVKEYAISKKYSFIDIDGVRMNFQDGWALIRCSNTGPNITMRFEATTNERLQNIQEEFTNLVNSLL